MNFNSNELIFYHTKMNLYTISNSKHLFLFQNLVHLAPFNQLKLEQRQLGFVFVCLCTFNQSRMIACEEFLFQFTKINDVCCLWEMIEKETHWVDWYSICHAELCFVIARRKFAQYLIIETMIEMILSICDFCSSLDYGYFDHFLDCSVLVYLSSESFQSFSWLITLCFWWLEIYKWQKFKN